MDLIKKSVLWLIVVLLSYTVYAHLDAGQDDVVNGYLIDFGYAPKSPSAGSSTIMNFNILDNSTQESINVTSVWIKISKGSTVVFTGSLRPDRGNTNFIFTFPERGNYQVLARFYNNSEILAEQKYNFEVSWKLSANNINYIILGATVILVVICIVFYSKKYPGKGDRPPRRIKH